MYELKFHYGESITSFHVGRLVRKAAEDEAATVLDYRNQYPAIAHDVLNHASLLHKDAKDLADCPHDFHCVFLRDEEYDILVKILSLAGLKESEGENQ